MIQGNNFAKARTIAQTSAPDLQDYVEKASRSVEAGDVQGVKVCYTKNKTKRDRFSPERIHSL